MIEGEENVQLWERVLFRTQLGVTETVCPAPTLPFVGPLLYLNYRPSLLQTRTTLHGHRHNLIEAQQRHHVVTNFTLTFPRWPQHELFDLWLNSWAVIFFGGWYASIKVASVGRYLHSRLSDREVCSFALLPD